MFYEHGKPLYVGLSDRLRGRIQEHGYKSSEKATFAFIFTREIWGLWNDEWKGPLPKNPDYNVKLGKGSLAVTVRPTKKALLEKKQIKQDSWSQIERVKKMQVRVIETKDEYEQAMFEVFAAYILNTPYNDFKPH